MKKIITLVALFCLFSATAQNVSDYKYIIIPAKFSFLKHENEYNMNALTKMVFEKQGYEVFYDNEILPQELAENRCKALYGDMKEDNGVFMTRIKIELKDCKNQVVYVSEEGKSREKDYATAYVQAFREVGRSIGMLRSTPIKEAVQSKTVSNTEVVSETKNPLLFAQPTANGVQLVDSTPKVVMRLFKSSVTNFYIAQRENLNGVVFNKNNQWYFEYYQEDKLVSEKIEIKF